MCDISQLDNYLYYLFSVSKSTKCDIHDLIIGTKSPIKMKTIKKQKKYDMKTVQVPSFLYSGEDKMFPKETVSSNRINLVDSSSMLSSMNINKPRVEIVASNSKNSLFTHSTFGVPSIIVRNLKMFPMMRNQKVDLEDKKADTPNDNKILRITSTGQEFTKFPSVSKILQTSMSEEAKEALEKWKQKKIEELGLEGFQKFNQGKYCRLISQLVFYKQTINKKRTFSTIGSRKTVS